MIKFLDGKIDERQVVATIVKGISRFAIVADHEGFSEVCIDNSKSFGPCEPIYGGPLTSEKVVVDADEATLLKYKFYRNAIQKGDTVEIVSGRKMRGEIKVVEDFFTYYYKYDKIGTDYVRFTDGTKVQRIHVKLLKPAGR